MGQGKEGWYLVTHGARRWEPGALRMTRDRDRRVVGGD